jgi:hypothetical protein
LQETNALGVLFINFGEFLDELTQIGAGCVKQRKKCVDELGG